MNQAAGNDTIMALLFKLVKLKGNSATIRLYGDEEGVYIETSWHVGTQQRVLQQGMSHMALKRSNSDIVSLKCDEMIDAIEAEG